MTSVILLHREASQISLFFLLMPHAAYKFVMFLFSKRLRNLDSISFSYTGNNESCLCRRRRHCKILGKEQKELGTIKIRRYSLQKNLSMFIHSFNKMVAIVEWYRKSNAQKSE